MLVFACAGLDALMKESVKNTFQILVDSHQEASKYFQERVERKIGGNDSHAIKTLARAIINTNPRGALILDVIQNLTAESLHSIEGISKICNALGLNRNQIITDERALRSVFQVRNQIAHEMDIDFQQFNRSRKPRPRTETTEYTRILLDTGKRFIEVTNSLIPAST